MTEKITPTFQESLVAFNKLYSLPAPGTPTLPPSRTELVKKLENFRDILEDEVDEVDDIITKLTDGTTTQPAILAEIADWLGDLMIYCGSELVKYGLEPETVLGIIMASNMSKLGEDGKPIINAQGKVEKGPNYWKPEPQLRRYIEAAARARGMESLSELCFATKELHTAVKGN